MRMRSALMLVLGIGVGYSLKPATDARLYEQARDTQTPEMKVPEGQAPETQDLSVFPKGIMIPDKDLSSLLSSKGLHLVSSALVRDREPGSTHQELVVSLIGNIEDIKLRDQAYTDAAFIAIRQMRGWQKLNGRFYN